MAKIVNDEKGINKKVSFFDTEFASERRIF